MQGVSYCVGNAAFHSSELYSLLSPAIPLLIPLLDDPMAKTRANAAGLSPTAHRTQAKPLWF